MRLLHTGDWHLGRVLHGAALLDDQAHLLEQFVDLARHESVDAVLVAGDVYDRSVPPADAVALLNDVLARLVVDVGVPVVLIAGNHDSAERLGFGARILERQGLHLRGGLTGLAPLRLADRAGSVAIHPLPYVEPLFARALPGGEHVADHQQATAHAVALLRAQCRTGERNVLVGHAFIAGGSESESERPLSVGGSGQVSAEVFAGFDYVALGHLHRPQAVGSDRIRYAGSLMKYSLAEAAQPKTVTLVELGADGSIDVRQVALSPRRDVRVVTGTLQALLAAAPEGAARDDYVGALLTDTDPVLDAIGRLRERYPNVLDVQFARHSGAGTLPQARGDQRQRQPADLFRAFYREMLGEDIGDDALAAFADAAAAAERAS